MARLIHIKLSLLLLYLMLPYKCFTTVDLEDQQQHVGASATDLENQLSEAKKYNMYCRASLGKISSHNFQNILDSIKHLLKQVLKIKKMMI
ncbi:MAG: hypothetical protein PG981_000883 [Wolbachia endosymbiont of Ctenocephalides orientis wCori]|nr:MAG: hypothetical protein PG981_000883 [Wolbachia endosymbiont of Ctenocephalides orientis wCori]